MDKIESLQQYKDILKWNKQRFQGIERNCYLMASAMDPDVNAGKLFYVIYENGLGIYVDEGRYYDLYYYWNRGTDFENFRQDKSVLIEVMGRDEQEPDQLLEQRFRKAGFSFLKKSYQYEANLLEKSDLLKYNNYAHRICEKGITISRCLRADVADQVCELWKSSLDQTDLPSEHFEFLHRKNDRVWCAVKNEEVIGAYWVSLAGRDTGEGRHIVVRSDYCRQGIATALMLHSMNECMDGESILKIKTWISTQNTKSILLHQSIGFQRKGNYCRQYILEK